MIPILYQTMTEGSVPSDYGIGPLTDTIEAIVSEQRNGIYELALTYAAEGIHAEDIQPGRFIMAKPNYTDDAQIFRIYKVGKTINGRFLVSAQHISYDLSGKVITTGSATSCVAACAVLDAAAGNFTIDTDKSVTANFSVSEPGSVRSYFGGRSGSLLDVYGGEWKYNNYTASLKQARGADRHVVIRYGKNLTELSQTLDMSNLVTGIIPYYIDTNGNKTVGTRVPTGLTLDAPRDIAIDFSQDVDPESSTAISTQLANLATRYKNNNNLTTITNSITLDFVQMQGLTERVDLCDTVSIYFEALGISASVKCIATEWDVLRERYSKTTFGDARTNIADTIAKATTQLASTPSTSFMSEAISHATELITGNLGGYVILHDSNNDGTPDEILIMNTADITTATQVWRWNKNGLGYSGTGYAGPYGTAITADGKIVADYILTGTLNADLIKAGTIEDAGHNSTINMTTGVARLKNLDAITRIRLLNSSLKEKWKLVHNSGTGVNMVFYNEAGKDCGGYSSTSNGGIFSILDTNEKTRCQLNYNGTISIYNASGSIRAQSHINGYGRGQIDLYDESGTACATLYGDGGLGLGAGGSYTITGIGSTGVLTCVSLVQTSSRKVKENIAPIEDAEKILELQAVSFDFKDSKLGTDKRGFIAEDVAEVLPNLVTPETETAPASLDYIGMIPYLQAVIKDQQKRIEALEDKLNNIGG